jgi:hypothetical protein
MDADPSKRADYWYHRQETEKYPRYGKQKAATHALNRPASAKKKKLNNTDFDQPRKTDIQMRDSTAYSQRRIERQPKRGERPKATNLKICWQPKRCYHLKTVRMSHPQREPQRS